jgi:uncharacterized protein (DUF1778 family)
MTMRGNFPLRLPDSIRKAAEAAAAKDGVSLNQFINLAVAEKTAALTGADMIAERAARADRAAFDAVMARVGAEPPRPGDEV